MYSLCSCNRDCVFISGVKPNAGMCNFKIKKKQSIIIFRYIDFLYRLYSISMYGLLTSRMYLLSLLTCNTDGVTFSCLKMKLKCIKCSSNVESLGLQFIGCFFKCNPIRVCLINWCRRRFRSFEYIKCYVLSCFSRPSLDLFPK